MVQRAKFGFPRRPARVPEVRAEIFEPTHGLDRGRATQELLRGYTPDSRNFEIDGGRIRPRSGLSRYNSTFALNDPILGGDEVYAGDTGLRYGWAASARTIAFLPPNATSWSTLSYIQASGAAGHDPDASFLQPWYGASLFDTSGDHHILVLTNDRQLPKFISLKPSTTTFSDYTFFSSLASRAAAVAAFDERFVWFNIVRSDGTYPNRVLWSERGSASGYSTSLGAGFRDLLDMRGTGVRMIPDADSLVLFSDEEIWRARRRDDFYAFSFAPVVRTMGGAYPRTICETPSGPVFLGPDFEVYLLQGAELVPLGRGPITGRDEIVPPSRIQRYIRDNLTSGETAFATYNSRSRRYELYIATTETSGAYLPRVGLWYSFDNASWFIQRFPFDVSHAMELRDTEQAVTWGSITYTWDQYNVAWGKGSLAETPRRVGVWSSKGTPYRFHSDQTSDDGTIIDARWRSHGLAQSDQLRYDTLYEVLIEYDSDVASQTSVFCSADVGASFDSGFSTRLSASSLSAFLVPVLLTGQSPVFEIRIGDGSRPRFSRFQARLRDGGLWGAR